MQANYVQRLRLNFRKDGPARYVGHLDLMRTLERALNRAKIPIAYSQGFNPRPRMAFAAPLPLGFCSSGELADIWLSEEMDPQTAREQMMHKMAPGITINHIDDVPLRSVSLQAATRAAIYSVFLLDPPELADLERRVQDMLAAEIIDRQWKRGKNKIKKYDLRPLIVSLVLDIFADGRDLILMKLLLSVGQTGRPDEVLRAMDLDPNAARITRMEIILDEDG